MPDNKNNSNSKNKSLTKPGAKNISIPRSVFWTLFPTAITGLFLLGIYLGGAKFDNEKYQCYVERDRLIKEKDELYSEMKLLRTGRKKYTMLRDSLLNLCPPISSVSGEIYSPNDSQLINNPDNLKVSGKVSKMPYDHHLWLVVHPLNSDGWWPQIAELTRKPNGEWHGLVLLGGKDNIGEEFQIHIVVTDPDANGYFKLYDKFEKTLPEGAKSLNYITVIKNR